MHINSMPTFITNHPIRFHTKVIPNSSIPAHTNRYYMHIHILHTLNRGNQPIMQPTTIMQEINTTCVRSCSSQEPSLKRQEQSRSSCRLSLRRDCEQRPCKVLRTLAQVRPSHLSELLKNSVFHLSECSRKNPWASFCYSRLGETSSLGRKQQFSLTVPRLQSQRFIQNSEQGIFISS